MNTEAKRDFIRKTYGDYIHGRPISEMPEKQVHTLHYRLMNEIEDLRNKYIAEHYYSRAAISISAGMSLFQLREAVNKPDDKEQPGYQYTLFDWQQELEGKEQEKEWKKNLK